MRVMGCEKDLTAIAGTEDGRGPRAKECVTSRSWKQQGDRYSPRASFQTSDLHSYKINKFVLLEVTNFVINCYSSNREPVHGLILLYNIM